MGCVTVSGFQEYTYTRLISQTHMGFNKMLEEQNTFRKPKGLMTSVRELVDRYSRTGMHDAWICNPQYS